MASAAARGGEMDGSRPIPPPLVPQLHADSLPLSFAQERLWFLDQLTPGNAAYNIPAVIRLDGDLSLRALVQSLHAIVDRHAILRTTFGVAEGLPVQVIAARWRPRVPLVDLGDLPAMRRETELRRLGGEESARPFDLARGPLLRAVLLRRRPREHVILLTLHHIVADCWSTGILVREMAALYQTVSTGAPAPLPDLPVQYADYARWQRQWLVGEALEAQVGYWREQLGGAPEVFDLPTDRTRPAVQSLRGAYVSDVLSGELAREVARLSQRRGATPFMVLLAAFFALLWRLTGQDDMIVGTPVANRTCEETRDLIGLFVNTLALRVEARGALDFLALLRRVRKAALDAYARQDLPFEKLIEEVQPQRSLAHATFVQVVFTFHDAPVDELTLPGLALVPVESGTGHAKLDLELSLRETRQGLLVQLEYSSDLFDATTARRLIGAFEGLLSSAVRQPQQTLRELPVLSRAQRHQVLSEWNDAAADLAGREDFVRAFGRTAAGSADIVAVAEEGGAFLTYRELDQRSDRLAQALCARGVGPERLVAILARRGLDWLAALVGVLKTGGAFLPLDPAQPPARLARLLERSGAGWLLAEMPLLRELEAAAIEPGAQPAQRLDLGALLALPSAPQRAMVPSAGPERLAYVIFTSGSTGVPKGAMVHHRGMCNHLQAKIRDLGLSAADCVAQTAAQSFDISIWQMLAALLVGGRVHVIGDDAVRDPRRLVGALARGRVTVLEVVPSLLAALLDAEPGAAFELRWLLATGEALPPSLAARWLAACPRVALLNAYGPTECSDDVSHHRVESVSGRGLASTPIGRPVVNTGLHVVDRDLRQTMVGVTGELCVAGAGVGRGYLGEPAKTAEVFVPDPFAEGGARLYRTGDLARHLPDGTIEYLGRRDGQVKIRGFRIELGEIEAAIRQHPGIQAAAVIASPGPQADARLVAYFVSRQGAVAPEALRHFVQALLPQSMVPSRFVPLARLPLLPTGKVDRRALQGSSSAG
jgi:amino acid adenylation domain-containing protein